jgi:hypothetical protein
MTFSYSRNLCLALAALSLTALGACSDRVRNGKGATVRPPPGPTDCSALCTHLDDICPMEDCLERCGDELNPDQRDCIINEADTCADTRRCIEENPGGNGNCEDGELRCDNGQPAICDNGRWTERDACEDGLECVGGVCVRTDPGDECGSDSDDSLGCNICGGLREIEGGSSCSNLYAGDTRSAQDNLKSSGSRCRAMGAGSNEQVWLFEAPESGNYVITLMTNVSEGRVGSWKAAVYILEGSGCGESACIAGKRGWPSIGRASCEDPPELAFEARAGQVYRIVVDGDGAGQEGPYLMRITRN